MFALICIACLLSVSFATAADDISNDTVSFSDNSLNEDNNEILKSGEGSFGDLEDIIDDADSGSTLVLDKDYGNTDDYDYEGIKVRKNLIIDGQGHTIDGKNKSRIFNLYSDDDDFSFELRNINFINGWFNEDDVFVGDQRGGALYCNPDKQSVTAVNCTFINNHARYSGAAMYGGIAINCTFILNFGGESGGATSHVDAKFCRFENNWGGDGPAMYKGSRFLCLVSSEDCYETETIIPTFAMFGSNEASIGSFMKFTLTYDDQEYDGYEVSIDLYDGGNCVNTYSATTGKYWTIPFVGDYDYKIYLKGYSEVEEFDGHFKMTSDVIIYPDEYSATFGDKNAGNLTIYLTDNIGNPISNVDVKVNDNDYKTDENGRFKINIEGYSMGTYEIPVSFAGTDYYLAANKNINLTIDIATSKLVSNNVNTIYSFDENFIVNLLDLKNNPLTNALITVEFNGAGKLYLTDENGQVMISTKNFAPGNYSVNLKFGGNDYYSPSYASSELVVTKLNTKLTVNRVESRYNLENYLLIDLFDNFGNPINDAVVSVNLNGFKNYTTDENGQIKISTKDLTPNRYNVDVVFEGSKLYVKSNSSSEVIITKDASKINAEMDDDYLTVTLTDIYDNPIADSIVSVNFGGLKNYTTDEYGQVKVSAEDFTPGRYLVNLTFNGNDCYLPSNVTAKVIVNKFNTVLTVQPVAAVYNVENYLLINLSDSFGNPLNGSEVSVNLNGIKKYTTDENGQIKVSTKALSPNNYTVDVVFEGSEIYESSNASTTVNITKNTATIVASSLTTVYNVNKNLVITLKDIYGNAISSEVVSVNIEGFKNYRTDAKGQITIQTHSLVPKTYNVKITFNGANKYTGFETAVKVTVKKATPKLTAKSKSFKKSVKTKKYTVYLKTNKNKVMKNSKVYLKVKGKTYKAKTNSKGQAKFKITKLTKKGKYKAVITYKGSAYYNKITKKTAIKIV